MGKVQFYDVKWFLDDNRAEVFFQVQFPNGELTSRTIKPRTGSELLAILDLLRNEGPLRFSTPPDVLFTGNEPVGEGEA